MFVARLKHWISVDSIDAMEIPIKHSPLKGIVVEYLEEKLSQDYKPLLVHEPGCWIPLCDVNHKTLEEKVYRYGFYSITSAGENSIINYYGNIMKVPYSRDLIPAERAVTMGPATICVTTVDGRATVVSRDKPSDGIEFMNSDFNGHLQDTFMAKNNDWYEIADFKQRKMVPYATSNSPPVASYNGLVWWALDTRCLMPTFVDFDNPGKVYHRPEKAIVGPYQGLFQQLGRMTLSIPLENVFAEGPCHDQFDLGTGTITRIQGSGDSVHMVLGFEKGLYRPRWVKKG